jgi:hypothetical protein
VLSPAFSLSVPLLVGTPRALPFPPWGRLSEKTFLSNAPGKRKGEVFTLGLTYPWQPADKEETDSRSGRSPTPEGEETINQRFSGYRRIVVGS